VLAVGAVFRTSGVSALRVCDSCAFVEEFRPEDQFSMCFGLDVSVR